MDELMGLLSHQLKRRIPCQRSIAVRFCDLQLATLCESQIIGRLDCAFHTNTELLAAAAAERVVWRNSRQQVLTARAQDTCDTGRGDINAGDGFPIFSN